MAAADGESGKPYGYNTPVTIRFDRKGISAMNDDQRLFFSLHNVHLASLDDRYGKVLEGPAKTGHPYERHFAELQYNLSMASQCLALTLGEVKQAANEGKIGADWEKTVGRLVSVADSLRKDGDIGNVIAGECSAAMQADIKGKELETEYKAICERNGDFKKTPDTPPHKRIVMREEWGRANEKIGEAKRKHEDRDHFAEVLGKRLTHISEAMDEASMLAPNMQNADIRPLKAAIEMVRSYTAVAERMHDQITQNFALRHAELPTVEAMHEPEIRNMGRG